MYPELTVSIATGINSLPQPTRIMFRQVFLRIVQAVILLVLFHGQVPDLTIVFFLWKRVTQLQNALIAIPTALFQRFPQTAIPVTRRITWQLLLQTMQA
jgi:hypothetical protein